MLILIQQRILPSNMVRSRVWRYRFFYFLATVSVVFYLQTQHILVLGRIY